ncbi:MULTISPECIES: hypothetical protein [unclassified Neochlamydia]|uniref:hypothetical protein n=1 Tax=unclassified Neochlamydia TaxID=2643326 RepID=UPI00140AE291|nr:MULTISPECIES: hypothetical protein [unclassified Neochlamydia]MBS4171390.1 Uncharacterized protein [Neochlamydia sp. AcF95]NGY94940.1 hypothetical protein [Neochlamydia sp. AcF84]
MKFILYFIFFGLLFYVIALYFPEAFQTLVSWADKVFAFLQNLFIAAIDKVNLMMSTPPAIPEQPVHLEAPQELACLWNYPSPSNL